MSQEYNENNRRSRRAARTQRHRPTLVTGHESEQGEQSEQARSTTNGLKTEAAPPQEEAVSAPPKRRLPGFFSSVGKKDEQKNEADVAQARLARATRTTTKSATGATRAAVKEEKKTESTPKSSSKAPARPASPFKTRYIIGMALYLIFAQVIGGFEQYFMKATLHWDPVLTQFALFGGNVTISASTLVFLVTLLLILVLLARFDLIPRNLAALGGSSAARRPEPAKSVQESISIKNVPPPMRQGVQGADDKLYQIYRANQRRDKKR